MADRFLDAYQPRNERLADIMRRMEICEVLFFARFFVKIVQNLVKIVSDMNFLTACTYLQIHLA